MNVHYLSASSRLQMLAKEESLFPTMYANLRRALVPLMDDDAYAAMVKTSSEVNAYAHKRSTTYFFCSVSLAPSVPTSQPVYG